MPEASHIDASKAADRGGGHARPHLVAGLLRRGQALHGLWCRFFWDQDVRIRVYRALQAFGI